MPEFWAGGGGLLSTGARLSELSPDADAWRQLRRRILRPETVALMGENQIGDMPAGVLKTASRRSWLNDLDFFPGAAVRWGLGYMLNMTPGPNGRSAGTVSWAGIFNSYYWLDPARRIAGVILTQMLPFADPEMLRLLGEFERGVYALAEAR